MALYKVDSDTADLTKVAGGTLYADAPVGTIFEYGGTTAPSGYGLCNHQAVSRTEYSELFGRIGTTYGSGDGSTTFNLPDKTQLKQDYTVKTLLDSWSSSLEDGSESHTFTASADGSYYFEVVLSNASSGKAGNNISLTSTDNKLISTWGYVGTGAVLFNKSVFLKAGTYVITHICQTPGIGGSSTVTVYSTRNEPVGSYIIKMKHIPVPTDFLDAVDDIIKDTTVDAVTNGDMNPITSNAVYDAMNSVDFATILSGTANVSVSDYICSKNIKNVCAMIKCRTSGIVLPSTKICSGFFTPLTSSTYPYLDIPFAIRNRITNITEMRMGYLDINGDFYTSTYTENIESDWDIQLFFSYITD